MIVVKLKIHKDYLVFLISLQLPSTVHRLCSITGLML